MGGTFSMYGRNEKYILVRKSNGKRPHGRPRYGWVDNTKMNLTEIGNSNVDWIHVTQDRVQWQAVVNTVMKL
jgi:hypothetical protein